MVTQENRRQGLKKSCPKPKLEDKLDEYPVLKILKKFTYYSDETDESEVYVRYDRQYKGAAIPEFCRISDPCFNAYVRVRFRKKKVEYYAPSIESDLRIIKDEAILDTDNRVRIIQSISGVPLRELQYYLGGNRRLFAIINKDGIEVEPLTTQPLLTSNYPNAQVEPILSGSVDLDRYLRKYINMSDTDYMVFKMHLIQYFLPTENHYAMVINSEKGSGKSTLSKIIYSLVDPNTNVCYALQDEAQIQNILINHPLVLFDNTKPLGENISNMLCSAITGTDMVKRKLYEDTAEVVIHTNNRVVLNGINIIPRKSDLRERSIVYSLRKISDDSRIPVTDIAASFEKDKPYILGCIFEILKRYFGIVNELKLEKSKRMADAYKDMVAIAVAMGISEKTFIKAYDTVERRSEEAAQTPTGDSAVEAVAIAIRKYLEGAHLRQLDGNSTSIMSKIQSCAKKLENFPKSVSMLGKVLNNAELKDYLSVSTRSRDGKCVYTIRAK